MSGAMLAAKSFGVRFAMERRELFDNAGGRQPGAIGGGSR